MSITGFGNAFYFKSKDLTSEILERMRNYKPRNITLDLIAKEHPECKEIAKRLGTSLKNLLIAENYRYVDENINCFKEEKFKNRKENYDFLRNKNLALLRQAANRIEFNTSVRLYYSSLKGLNDFDILKQIFIDNFEK